MERSERARPPGVSMFFPAYNDGGTIASLVIRAVQTTSQLTPDFEMMPGTKPAKATTPPSKDPFEAHDYADTSGG